MTKNELIKAIRCCGSSPNTDRCESECVFFQGSNRNKCIPKMTQAVAEELEKTEATIERVRDEVCVKLCKYSNTADDDCICQYIKEGHECPLEDLL